MALSCFDVHGSCLGFIQVARSDFSFVSLVAFISMEFPLSYSTPEIGLTDIIVPFKELKSTRCL